MFSVDLTQFPEYIQEMISNASLLDKLMGSLEQSKSVLHSLSGMTEIIEQIQILDHQMEEEKRGFEQLAHTLEEVKRYYEHCEHNIEAQYEQGTVAYQKLEATFSNIDAISSLFQEMERE